MSYTSVLCLSVLVVALLCAPSHAAGERSRKQRWQEIVMKLLQSNSSNETSTPTPTPTATHTATPSPTPSATPSATNAPTTAPTATPAATPTPTATTKATATPVPSATAKPLILLDCVKINNVACGGRGSCLYSTNATHKIGSCSCSFSTAAGFWQGVNCDQCYWNVTGADCKSSCPCNATTSVCEGTTTKCACIGVYAGAGCNMTCPLGANGLTCGGYKYGSCNRTAATPTCTCTSIADADGAACKPKPGQETPVPVGTVGDATVTTFVSGDISTWNKPNFNSGVAGFMGVGADKVNSNGTAASVKVDFSVKTATGAVDLTAMNRFVDAVSDPSQQALIAKRLGLDLTKGLPTLKVTYVTPAPTNASKVPPAPTKKISGASAQSVSLVATVAAAILAVLMF